MITVQELHIYPLKSGRGIPRERVQVAPTGFNWDRHWMMVNAKGQFLSQRTHPTLARMRTELNAREFTLQCDAEPPLRLPLALAGTAVPVKVWNDVCEGLDQGEAAAQWASQRLGEPVRIVRMPAAPKRLANAQYAGPTAQPVSFADGFPILVCNQASLAELNRRMPDSIGMERFRPNLVLGGLPAFAEDRITALRIGAVTLTLVKPCTRCVITSTDQHTGARSTNPLPVLKSFRMDHELKGVTFGENAVPTRGIGDHIDIGARCDVEYDA